MKNSYSYNSKRNEKTDIQRLLSKRFQKEVTFPPVPTTNSVTNRSRRRNSIIDEQLNARNWFYVKSPREIHGVVGPKSLKDLRLDFKTGVMHEKTLVWTEGQGQWQQLRNTTSLWDKIFDLPPIPFPDNSKEQPNEVDVNKLQMLSSFPNIPDIPSPLQDLSKLNKSLPDWACSECGNNAVSFMSQKNDLHIPDVKGSRSPKGSTSNATEIIPAFLWIGNASTGRSRTIEQMQITLVINCAIELKQIESKFPLYRCKHIPLPDDPKPSEVDQSTYFKYFGLIYDWIELERVAYDRVDAGRPTPVPFRGRTDEYGDPIKHSDSKLQHSQQQQRQQSQQQTLQTPEKLLTPRILLYSRLGVDRPCLLLAAYLIRRWGVTAETALDIISQDRIGLHLCPPHFDLLRQWAQLHTLGNLLCEDCRLRHLPSSQTSTSSSTSVRGNGSASPTNHRPIRAAVDTSKQRAEELSESVKYDVNDSRIRTTHPEIGDLATFLQNMTSSNHHNKLSSLGHPAFFLTHCPLHEPTNGLTNPLPSSNDTISTQITTNLFDLHISGENLSERKLCTLFEALLSFGILRRIRRMKLPGNRITGGDIEAIVPVLSTANRQSDSTGKGLLLEVLDLSHNSIGEQGAQAIALFLCNSNTITTLDLTETAITDTGAMAILAAIEGESEFLDADAEAVLSEAQSQTQTGDSLKDHSEVTANPMTFEGLLTAINSKLSSSSTISALMESFEDSSLSRDELNKKDAIVKRQRRRSLQMGRPVEEILKFNKSLRNLNLSNNDLGPATALALSNTMRSNQLLTSLQLDFNPKLQSKEIRSILSTIRAFNCQLHMLSLCDIPMSVNSAFQIMKIFSRPEVPLEILHFARCGLTHKHLKSLPEQIGCICHLTHLDISGNPIGDRGAQVIASVIEGVVSISNKDGLNHAPIKSLDMSGCGITKVGAQLLFEAIAGTKLISQLDLSDNSLGSNIHEIAEHIVNCRFISLNLNRCKLGTKGAGSIMDSLQTTTMIDCCGSHIRSLSLSGNDIQNSIASNLKELILSNLTIEFIDLGFNGLNTTFRDEISHVPFDVIGKGLIDKKLNELHINLVGNECGQLELETPGHFRSKVTLRYFNDEERNHSVAMNAGGSFQSQSISARQAYRTSPLYNINSIG